MKKPKFYIIALCLLIASSTFAQVQIDHAILLTGNGTNAKVSGIKSVTDSLDATSVQSVQSGTLIYAVATGSNNNFNITIYPPITAYQAGMVFNFISNQNVSGPATLNVNNLGAIPIKKFINKNLAGCEIQNKQVVTVVYDGTNFQMTSVFAEAPTAAYAGSDQLNQQDTTINLAANTAINGSGLWTVVRGTGGSFSNPASANSTFTGISGNAYVLSWTITGDCSTSSDTINVSFIGSQTFSYTGSQQTFTVPTAVTRLTFDVYGAQGGSVASNSGGYGGYARGTLSVTQGDLIYIFVGNQPSGTAGGYNGGGAGIGSGAGGGGASDVRVGGTDLASRVIVAGGGGGVPSTSWSTTGGSGGGTSGGLCSGGAGPGYDGQGASQSAGGPSETVYHYAGAVENGSLGQGGQAGTANNSGGGGGGGYYGGGGGDAGGGGGGSGYIGGVSAANMQNGLQSGNGQVVVTWYY